MQMFLVRIIEKYFLRCLCCNITLFSMLFHIYSVNIGEGEHKIMDYIRKQRSSPDHDPNTQHVLCGADADLIMLGLATHEPNFTIIREEFKPNKPRPCDLCRQMGHEMVDCQGAAKPLEGNETIVDEVCSNL